MLAVLAIRCLRASCLLVMLLAGEKCVSLPSSLSSRTFEFRRAEFPVCCCPSSQTVISIIQWEIAASTSVADGLVCSLASRFIHFKITKQINAFLLARLYSGGKISIQSCSRTTMRLSARFVAALCSCNVIFVLPRQACPATPHNYHADFLFVHCRGASMPIRREWPRWVYLRYALGFSLCWRCVEKVLMKAVLQQMPVTVPQSHLLMQTVQEITNTALFSKVKARQERAARKAAVNTTAAVPPLPRRRSQRVQGQPAPEYDSNALQDDLNGGRLQAPGENAAIDASE
jgi:hypothetical protein